jgi:hypothetical protein
MNNYEGIRIMVDATSEFPNSSTDHKKKKELPADLLKTTVINKNTGLWEIAIIAPLYVFLFFLDLLARLLMFSFSKLGLMLLHSPVLLAYLLVAPIYLIKFAVQSIIFCTSLFVLGFFFLFILELIQ